MPIGITKKLVEHAYTRIKKRSHIATLLQSRSNFAAKSQQLCCKNHDEQNRQV